MRPRTEHAVHELPGFVEEENFFKRLVIIVRGFRAPKDSGARKRARFYLARLSAPLVAIAVNVGIVAALMSVVLGAIREDREFEVTVLTPEEIELDDILKEVEELDLDLPEMPDVVVPTEAIEIATPDVIETVTQPDLGKVDAIRSPVVLKNLLRYRSAAGRAAALREHHGSAATEGAVLKALRWLKANQDPTGCWKGGGSTPAMTGLAILTFLAHGETPNSDEFGETLEKAFRYLASLLKPDGRLRDGAGHSYAHAIVTYAACEGYALTKIPALKEFMEKAVGVIIEGQQDGGAWDYHYNKGERKDMSVAGWQIQALKAAKIAGCEHPRLEEAMKKAFEGLQSFYDPNRGGFGYGGPGATPLTAAGTLCLQLMGHARHEMCKRGLLFMGEWGVQWEEEGEKRAMGRPLYHWYYATQAKFQQGGETWNRWNQLFAPALVRNQAEDGHWEVPEKGQETQGPVYNTTLCALMLEVYYRILPTYKPVEDIEEEEPEIGVDDLVPEIT